MENRILASVVQSREAYEYVESFVRESDFSPRGWRIWQEITSFYDRDGRANRADVKIIGKRIARTLPTEKMAQPFYVALDALTAADVSPKNIAQEFLELRRGAVGDRLAQAIITNADSQKLAELHEEYGTLLQAAELRDDHRVDLSKVPDLSQNKIRVLPGILNHAIGGGVHRGDTIVLFGRPNAGKSLCLINMAVGFLHQGLRVMHIENEDGVERIRRRIQRRMLQQPDEWFNEHPEEAGTMLADGGIDRYGLFKLTPGTPRHIRSMVKQFQPDVLLVNQIRGIASSMPGKITQNMENAQVAIRNIGQEFDLITVSVTQAHAPRKDSDGNVIEKAILWQEDIDQSLTGVPGACDFIFGYGVTRDLRENKTAVISVCKSKDKGDGEHFYVGVDPSIDKLLSTRA